MKGTFDPEDGCNAFFRNDGIHLHNNTVPKPRTLRSEHVAMKLPNLYKDVLFLIWCEIGSIEHLRTKRTAEELNIRQAKQ
jgi:hypothetical protein